jgi:alpha-L-fucosidase
MKQSLFSRRSYLKVLGAGAALRSGGNAFQANNVPDSSQGVQWLNEAKFGMFIHWGLYSVLARHEWALEHEGIPLAEYERLANQFLPKPNALREWARLAKKAGQKYMLLTTKHHEGFCLFDTKYTDYCAPKQACGRDLVKEFVEAARAEGLRVGLYYSPMDWHHPDGAICGKDEAARKRFVDFTHGQIKELMTNYGKVDMLWFDMKWPLDPKQWEWDRLMQMVRSLQPNIISNSGDFGTFENKVGQGNRPWVTCATMNDSWGYQAADSGWKTPKRILSDMVSCAAGGGCYLLNVGPKADGTIPAESVATLETIGPWLARNGEAINGTERCNVGWNCYANHTRKGNTLYMHVHYWPPDEPITVLALECDSAPTRGAEFVRINRVRGRV